MERDKLIIIGLIIIIISLFTGLTLMIMGDNNLSTINTAFPEGMRMYDFNSEFKMAVPDDVHFLKEWNSTDEFNFGQAYSYFDKNNEICIRYVNSPLITHEIVDGMIRIQNASGNYTFEFDNGLIISHNIKNNGKLADSYASSNFTYTILLEQGHRIVFIQGNDLDLIKSMIDTIEFYD